MAELWKDATPAETLNLSLTESLEPWGVLLRKQFGLKYFMFVIGLSRNFMGSNMLADLFCKEEVFFMLTRFKTEICLSTI